MESHLHERAFSNWVNCLKTSQKIFDPLHPLLPKLLSLKCRNFTKRYLWKGRVKNCWNFQRLYIWLSIINENLLKIFGSHFPNFFSCWNFQKNFFNFRRVSWLEIFLLPLLSDRLSHIFFEGSEIECNMLKKIKTIQYEKKKMRKCEPKIFKKFSSIILSQMYNLWKFRNFLPAPCRDTACWNFYVSGAIILEKVSVRDQKFFTMFLGKK